MNEPDFPKYARNWTETITHKDALTVHRFENADPGSGNIDPEVVDSFGHEWERFSKFDPEEIDMLGSQYFDIVGAQVLSPSARCLDVGCGSGRWTSFVAPRVGSVDAVDPSSAVFVAARACAGLSNVRVAMASADELPFDDASFDFIFSLGVLHHVPDTAKALNAVVRKAKPGGHVLIYLYYALDGRPAWYRTLFAMANFLRKWISKLPAKSKQVVCDLIAATVYYPFARTAAILRAVGVPERLVNRLPLSYYRNCSFFVMRNDSLDRFGTTLEQRFTRVQIIEMMNAAGLRDVVVSEGEPYWHAIGQKI
jgi:ubiquinone/menaquinone biosynthesis C-methylase UbiE